MFRTPSHLLRWILWEALYGCGTITIIDTKVIGTSKSDDLIWTGPAKTVLPIWVQPMHYWHMCSICWCQVMKKFAYPSQTNGEVWLQALPSSLWGLSNQLWELNCSFWWISDYPCITVIHPFLLVLNVLKLIVKNVTFIRYWLHCSSIISAFAPHFPWVSSSVAINIPMSWKVLQLKISSSLAGFASFIPPPFLLHTAPQALVVSNVFLVPNTLKLKTFRGNRFISMFLRRYVSSSFLWIKNPMSVGLIPNFS